MLQSILTLKIARGLAKAAAVVGAPESLFRPVSLFNPVEGAPFSTIYCAYDVNPDFKLISTARQDHAYAALLADPTLVLQGDYLVGDDTHFVARVEPLRPALCVLCTETVDFLNTDVSTSAGTNSYGGRTDDTDTAVAQAWPVSMIARSRIDTVSTKLPSDIHSAFYEILVPPMPGLTLYFGMRIRDSSQQEYEIVTADYSPFGWKLLAGLTTT